MNEEISVAPNDEGKIPIGYTCKYSAECNFKDVARNWEGCPVCNGKTHTVEFSCANARAFKISDNSIEFEDKWDETIKDTLQEICRDCEKVEKLIDALREIASYGFKHSGCGYTCATMATTALNDLGKMGSKTGKT
ncbi:MAG: hypothetical protein WC119_00850 [Synergistaceae bacterium]